MQRHTLVWLAAPLMALTLAGCGDRDADESPVPESGTPETPATIGETPSDSAAPAPGYTPPPPPAPAGDVAPDGMQTPEGEVAPPPDESTPPDE